LGGAIARRLMLYGAEVHGTGRRNRSPSQAVHHRAHLPEDTDSLLNEVMPEWVFHLAAPVEAGASADRSAVLRAGIVDAALSMAEATGRLGIPMLHAGTCAEYGRAPAPFREDGVAVPIDAYGELKLEATLAMASQPHVTIVRPFRAIGPGDESSVVAAAARDALAGQSFAMTSGEQRREWNHVDAIAEGIVRAAAHPEAKGRLFNIGGGPVASVLEAVRAVFAAAGADGGLIQAGARPQRPAEIPLLAGDHDRAMRLWGPLVQPSFAETIRQSVLWMAERGEGAA
jgi:nucleoside-diphosphate-sugar epimerase